MIWTYDPQTQTTGDSAGIIPRVQMEEAIARLIAAGIRNRLEIIRILCCLTELSDGEVGFNVDLVFAERRDSCSGL